MIKVGNKSYCIEDIYLHYSDFDLLKYYLNIVKIPCHISSPLRRDIGKDMALFVNPKDGHIWYKDHARGNSGTTLKLLSEMWRLNEDETIKKILTDRSNFSTNKLFIDYQNGTRKYRSKGRTKLQIKIRDWEQKDYSFWLDFGINKTLLNKARIIPISFIFINEKPIKADPLAFAFIEKKENRVTYKIYQPFNKRMKWLNNHDSSVISLWDMMPKKGEKLVICSSVKDALCLTACTDIPAIALQGEGYSISKSALNNLKRRFDKIFICLDNDEPGKKYAEKLENQTGFTNIVLPLDMWESKDIADMYKNNINKEEIKNLLKNLFI